MSNAIATAKRLYKAKRYEKALGVLLSLGDSEEDNPDVSYYLGLCYFRMGRYDDALLHLEQVVTTHPDFLHLYQCRLLLAIIYSKTQRYSLAEYEVKNLLEGGFESVQVFSVYSFILSQQGKIDESIDYIFKAMELDPENANVLNSTGYLRAEQGDNLEEALELCKRAVRLRPEEPAYLDSLGWVYFKLGKYREAHRYIKKAYQMAEDHPIIRTHLDKVVGEFSPEE
ncbi:MAG: tetratricopeptide repeat protein [Sediminispirochaetaceae bacterium]